MYIHFSVPVLRDFMFKCFQTLMTLAHTRYAVISWEIIYVSMFQPTWDLQPHVHSSPGFFHQAMLIRAPDVQASFGRLALSTCNSAALPHKSRGVAPLKVLCCKLGHHGRIHMRFVCSQIPGIKASVLSMLSTIQTNKIAWICVLVHMLRIATCLVSSLPLFSFIECVLRA